MSNGLETRMPAQVSVCPHCGGHNGVLSFETLLYGRLTSWSGSDVGADYIKTLTQGRKPRCNDCGKSVRMPKASMESLI